VNVLNACEPALKKLGTQATFDIETRISAMVLTMGANGWQQACGPIISGQTLCVVEFDVDADLFLRPHEPHGELA
jgi:hypothetical protein